MARESLLQGMGGEEGCRRLSTAFYARVGKDPALRPLFPGKSLKCATEEFAAFLIQFLDGEEGQTQRRWWLSLRESHARFRIGPDERRAWLRHMQATLAVTPMDAAVREALGQFFDHSSAYVIGRETPRPEHEELAARWDEQRLLDDAIAALAAGHDTEALALALRFRTRPAIFVGLLARMIQSGRPAAMAFVLDAVGRDPSLTSRRFAGRTLLHWSAGEGRLEVVRALLAAGADPEAPDGGDHAPLYSVANQCASAAGPEIVRILVEAGADVNRAGGVTRATALHMAARRGFVEIARTLIASGASLAARDTKGDTPLDRALHCRRQAVAQLLREHANASPG